MEMAVKKAERAARSAGRRRRPSAAQGAPPAPAGHHGGAPPLSPLPPWLLGAVDEPSPMEMRPWGRQNSWLLVAAPKLGFSSPYISWDDHPWPSDGCPFDPRALGHL